MTRGLDLARAAKRPEHHYGLLLLLILLALGVQMAVPDEAGARFLSIALQALTLIVALRLAGAHRLLLVVATLAVAGTVVAAGFALLGVDDPGTAPARITNLLLVALAPPAIAVGLVREVREHGMVTVRTMFGVLCIYLLLGMLFATGFAVVEAFSSRPFFAAADQDTTANYLYFSFATQTTVGYGDLVASTNLGRSIAITEALIGQIYLVTVVALIVSNLGRPRGTLRRGEP